MGRITINNVKIADWKFLEFLLCSGEGACRGPKRHGVEIFQLPGAVVRSTTFRWRLP
jgi:hypothetical protein